MGQPVEAKVQASTLAAAVSGLALYALGRYAFKGAVPDVIASWVYVLVPAVITFAAGYLARHTPRPDLAPPQPAPAVTTVAAPVLGAPPEKTLITPAAPESDQPGAAGPPA